MAEKKLINIPDVNKYPYIKRMLKLAAIDRWIEFIGKNNQNNLNTNIPLWEQQWNSNELLKRLLAQPTSYQSQNQKWIDLLRWQTHQSKIQPLYSNNPNYRNRMIEILLNWKKF
jgi:hypothetical protein